MVILSPQKKIVLVAFSLFFVSLSLVFVLTDHGSGGKAENFGNNLLGSVFQTGHGSEEEHAPSHEAAPQDKVPSLVISKAGEVVSLDEAFSATFHYTRADLTGDIYSLFDSDDLSDFVRDFTKFSQEKHPKETISGPFRFLLKSGEYHLVLLTFSLLDNGIQINFKDITESVEELHKKSDSGKKIQDIEEQDGARIVVEKL